MCQNVAVDVRRVIRICYRKKIRICAAHLEAWDRLEPAREAIRLKRLGDAGRQGQAELEAHLAHLARKT
jgi:hypothetical protein